MIAVIIDLPAVQEQIWQLTIISYAEHLAPYLYEVPLAANKILLEVGVVQHYFWFLSFDIPVPEILQLAKTKVFAYMLIALKHIGVAGNDDQFIVGVLCFYGTAYGGGGYAFAYTSLDLEYNFHKIV
jgi:hypothetical protein